MGEFNRRFSKLRIQESDVEGRVVDDEFGILRMNSRNSPCTWAKVGSFDRRSRVKSMHRLLRPFVDVALWDSNTGET